MTTHLSSPDLSSTDQVPTRHGALRLTHRGRLVVLLTLVGLLLAAFSLGRVGTQAAPAGADRAELGQTVVQPGESLWAVANRVAPGHDPRAVIDQIADLNDLDSSAVQVGQLLVVPAR
ncbi:MAG TPA: LysM peptidoglycan-binding domain-containing protein [Mycobacteriales bacterium]|nr:LysM peptidoglycan-binding domain-containing protein [Mycobacteriales bacterium]